LNYVPFLLVVVRVGRFYIDWKFGQDHRSNQPSAHHVDSKKKKGHRVGVVHIVVLYVKKKLKIIDQLRKRAFGL
jgi:hypothetical protein